MSRSAGKEDGYFLYWAPANIDAFGTKTAGEIYKDPITVIPNNSFNMTRRSLDPVHIKYKSSPHAVLAFNYDSNGS